VNAKKALGKRAPTLCWNFLAFEHNAHEIPAAAALARKLGLDYFRVARPFDVGWDDPAIRPAENVTAKTQRQNWMRMNLNRRNNWNPFPQEMPGEAFLQAYDELGNQPAEAGETPNPGRTCHWLYKNMVMDATGRIMPCCGPPGAQANLVFGSFDRGSTDVFNSAKYRRARESFVDPSQPSPADPHCARCEWDQTTVNIGGPEIRRYFKSAGRPFSDRRTLDLLSDW
jgi:MoaA/NifB/PqqE/SkfB family radical SAM enzyme